MCLSKKDSLYRIEVLFQEFQVYAKIVLCKALSHKDSKIYILYIYKKRLYIFEIVELTKVKSTKRAHTTARPLTKNPWWPKKEIYCKKNVASWRPTKEKAQFKNGGLEKKRSMMV
ncbi:unnamed protein product [Camellia sinensis]